MTAPGPTAGSPGTVVVARKWSDRRPAIDPLTGEVRTEARTSGASDADDAALAAGLEIAAAWGLDVVAVTAGGAGAEAVLRTALAAGAARAVRVDLADGQPSAAVAAALAPVARSLGARAVVCGAMSLDRGSGAVPALLAHHLDAAQALGLVALRLAPGRTGTLEAWRRLDGGRRERLAVTAPCVLSVEGAAARLGRATLPALRAAASGAIEVVAAAAADTGQLPPPPARRGPRRPRPHVVAPPDAGLDARGRVLELMGTATARVAGSAETLEPADAARRILEALTEWGQFP